jgi:DNA-binding PadR family transcriptional regulator
MVGHPSEAEILILGMLYVEPKHGYELDRLIKERGTRNWANIGFSSIYYLLEKLERRGHVESDDTSGKARKTYSITAVGREFCELNTRRLLEERVANKNPFMVGIANSFTLSKASFQEQLAKREKELVAQLSTLEAIAEKQGRLPSPAELLFSYSRSLIRAEIAWIKEVNTQKEQLLET